MDLWSYEQTTAKNVISMDIKSQVGNENTFKGVVSTSSSEFAMMTTDCPTSQCNIANKYDYLLAPDEESNVRAKETIFKFDDQPMSSFLLEGSLFIDNFEFGIDYLVEELKFIGINRAYYGFGFDTSKEPHVDSRFMFRENIQGILGLAPPQDEASKNRHFLFQLQEKGVIEHLVFAIFMESDENGRSDIKFGSYDTDRIESGHQLAMIETLNTTTWAVEAKDFKIGAFIREKIENGEINEISSDGHKSFLDGTRKAFIEPSSPFIYVPPADFVLFARQLQLYYGDQGLKCTYDNLKKSLSSSCRFEKPCSEITAVDSALFHLTLFDSKGGEVVVKLEGKDMFVPGKLIDDDDKSIADYCFIPILKHNYGPVDTWFLGAPILDGYYAVFDMSQGSYLQVGISVKNDEAADALYNFEGPPLEKPQVVGKWIVIILVLIMVVITIAFVACKKKRESTPKGRESSLMSDEVTPGENLIN